MRFSISILMICLVAISSSLAQNQEGNQLGIDAFYQLVKSYHPVAKQAQLIANRGELELRATRGIFDPKLSSSYSNKNFDSKQYYELWNTYLELPTVLPFDFKVGYEQNSGTYLNPENNTDNAGLYYAGISIPLGQGLLANVQNIDLKKGKISNLSYQNQASIVLNNLLVDANQTYWMWYGSYEKMKLIKANVQLMEQRYEGIRQASIGGELAAIDSVEALIQVQEWNNTLRKAEYEYLKSNLLLQNFIWTDSSDINLYQPILTFDDFVSDIVVYEGYSINHPELVAARLQSDVIDLDRRMAGDQLKPTINLNYNFLLTEQSQFSEHVVFDNNYKAGVEFELPLFLRKERAKLKTVGLKAQENQLKIMQKSREINNKVDQYYNKCLALQNMIDQQQLVLDNYIALANAERVKFNNGESSIFLINSRENKKISAEMKLIELRVARGIAIGRLLWSSGMLSQ